MSGLDSMELDKIGFGQGTTVGFTDDGFVFVVVDTKQKEDGRPTQTQLLFRPERARAFANSIEQAAMKASEIFPEVVN